MVGSVRLDYQKLLEGNEGVGWWEDIPGTTSRASMASSYSMKPKPFISLISVILPEPWVLKCSSMSCLVTTSHLIADTVSCTRFERRMSYPWWLSSRGIELLFPCGSKYSMGKWTAPLSVGVRGKSSCERTRVACRERQTGKERWLTAYHCGEGSQDRVGWMRPQSWRWLVRGS